MGMDHLKKILESKESDASHALKKAEKLQKEIEDHILAAKAKMSSLDEYLSTYGDFTGDRTGKLMVESARQEGNRLTSTIDTCRNSLAKIRRDISKAK